MSVERPNCWGQSYEPDDVGCSGCEVKYTCADALEKRVANGEGRLNKSRVFVESQRPQSPGYIRRPGNGLHNIGRRDYQASTQIARRPVSLEGRVDPPTDLRDRMPGDEENWGARLGKNIASGILERSGRAVHINAIEKTDPERLGRDPTLGERLEQAVPEAVGREIQWFFEKFRW